MRTPQSWIRTAAARLARGLGGTPATAPPTVRLDDVRRRLEILLAAVYGREIPIVAAQARAGQGGWMRRMRAPAHLRAADAVAGTDGERIHLPPVLDAAGGTEAALARYRLMAIEQAERIARGTFDHAPGDGDRLARDLYLLLESAAADAAIARTAPGVLPALQAERASALAGRPPLESLTEAERAVESLVRRLLAVDPAHPPRELAPGATPAESLARARTLAARVRASGGRYRGVPAVGAWGTVVVAAGRAGRAGWLMRGFHPRMMMPGRRGFLFQGAGSGDGDQDGEQGSAQGAASSADPGPPRESDAPSQGGAFDPDAAGGTPAAAEAKPADEAVAYPEWDHAAGSYLPRACQVRTRPAAEGDEQWAASVLSMHAVLVRRLRERFERLRAQRARQMHQRDGDELDVEACVRAMADWRTGHSIDDRLYMEVRPARRGMAIMLLVDISGSTSEFVDGHRIIDIEKVAVLLTGEALDALGDLYAVLTFSGAGAADVRLRTLKDFGERNGAAVRQRISALQPEGFTRLGAAVRHATALLARQNAGHRLLLILSDGKPNDQDHYQGRYAVEDSRQAIAEARARGVHPFCLTVDKEGAAYLARIFGEPGHMILRQPDQLPLALVKVVRQILSNR